MYVINSTPKRFGNSHKLFRTEQKVGEKIKNTTKKFLYFKKIPAH